jgi:hypothetical protein
MEQTYGIATSSVDSTKLSTTLLSILKTVAGFLVGLGLLSIDQNNSLLANANVIVQGAIVGAPIAYGMWHSAEIIFGLFQKIAVKFFKKKAVVTPVVVTNPEVLPA